MTRPAARALAADPSRAPCPPATEPPCDAIAARLGRMDWAGIESSLDALGYATMPSLLSREECAEIAGLYARDALFRSRIVMQRHAFGRGEYKYLSYPLPPLIEALRHGLYPLLAPVANRWRAALGEAGAFPATLDAFLAECHEAGQTRPTPLLLRYGPDDYNCLHQDLYGALVFPLQLTVLLSEAGRDFAGGEFVLVESRPRAQSKAEVVPLAQGDAVIFAVHHRPVRGTRGWYRVALRHGVSRLRSGGRQTLGIIFHDAA